MTLAAWRQRYERLGLATVPLWAGSKRPVCPDWQATPPPVQWYEAGDRAGNIGLRTGNRFGVGDADAIRTAETLYRIFTGLGLKPPTIVTPSGGRHYWLTIRDAPPGKNYYLWHSDVGPGELRVGPGAQVAAPCSIVDGKRYRFLSGTAPESLPKCVVHWRDLQALIRPKSVQPIDALPVPFPRQEIAGWATWVLGALHEMPRGGRVARPQATLQGLPRRDSNGRAVVTWYNSRSEAEQAVVLHAVWCGWNFAEVAALFESRQPGHYAEQRDKDGYLRLCWRSALGWLAGTPARETIAELWQWAECRAWPGRGGGNEFLAYRALLQRAWLAGTLHPNVSRRDVELFGSMGDRGARGALQRLQWQGLVFPYGQRERPTHAQAWQLVPDVHTAEPVTVAPSRGIDALPGDAELWAVLGRAAGMVYARLDAEPQRVEALATATGKHRSTVYRALDTLARHELAILTPTGWVTGERDAAEVAHETGAVARKNRREAEIEDERATFREGLAAR